MSSRSRPGTPGCATPTSGCCRGHWATELARLLLLAVAAATACSLPRGAELVRIMGSDTMLELNRKLAVEFMRSHPGVAVRVEGGGTGSGVRALIEGAVDLCAASRPFTPEEVSALHARAGTLGVRVLVARDALSVYLNPANPIADLSLTKLHGIFSGTIVDWGEVGGLAGPIVPVVRPPASGTAQFFRDHVLAGQGFTPAARLAARTDDVVAAVAAIPGAVGFGGLVQGSELVHARLDGVAPTAATVRDGSYPLARYLYFYATAPPTGSTKDFTDWCMSPAGQQVVAEVGFIPLWATPA